jgi:hypothetical protein
MKQTVDGGDTNCELFSFFFYLDWLPKKSSRQEENKKKMQKCILRWSNFDRKSIKLQIELKSFTKDDWTRKRMKNVTEDSQLGR